MKKYYTIWVLFFAQMTLAIAQDKVWTLDDCIHYAIGNNPQRVKQEAQNHIYRQDQIESIGGFLPSLSAASRVSMNYGR